MVVGDYDISILRKDAWTGQGCPRRYRINQAVYRAIDYRNTTHPSQHNAIALICRGVASRASRTITVV
jgi:hypothetical protein